MSDQFRFHRRYVLPKVFFTCLRRHNYLLSGKIPFIGGDQALPGNGNCRETPVKGVPKQGSWERGKIQIRVICCFAYPAEGNADRQAKKRLCLQGRSKAGGLGTREKSVLSVRLLDCSSLVPRTSAITA
jgi:hypothetical protein